MSLFFATCNPSSLWWPRNLAERLSKTWRNLRSIFGYAHGTGFHIFWIMEFQWDLSDSRSKQLDIENMKRENNGKYMNITVNHWGMTLLISPMIYPRTSHEKTGWFLAVHGYMWCMEIPAGFFCRGESKASNAKECPRQLNFGNDQSNVVQVGTS